MPHGRSGGGASGGRGGTYGRGLPQRPGEILRALRFAYRQRGTPYVWGGAAPGGFDCSGLVYWAYTKAGYHGMGRTTYQQILQGRAVGRNQLHPGDIVFPEAGHEGLYIGNGMVLEAPHTGDVVKTIPLSSFGFWQARRLIGGGGGIIPPRGIAGQNHFGLPVGSNNPQDRQPHPNFQAEIAQQQQANAQAMAQFQKQQQQMLAKQQTQFLGALQTQAAQTRQQGLAQQAADQLFQRHQAGAQAQMTLTGQPAAGLLSGDPTANLVEQNRQKAVDLRQKALQRAGIA
jgi:hypothetical protein